MTMIQAFRANLGELEESPWNVNVMDAETFESLLIDMKRAGPEQTDPIDIATLIGRPGFITIDGAHRLRAAKKLGWEYLYAISHPEVATEEDARLFNYRRDADRGQIDPFKLAESFKWFIETQKMSQADVAKKFGVDNSTVSHRLSLLKVDEQVKEYALKTGKMTTSHLEVVASLEPELQREVVKDIQKDWRIREAGGVASVKQMQEIAQEVKREADWQKRFRDAVADAKYPVCPTCGKPPIPSHLPPPIVQCESKNYSHEWNVNTGKPGNRYQTISPSASSKPSLPQHVKSQRMIQEYNAAGDAFLKKLYPQLTEIWSIHLSGKIGKKTVDLDWMNTKPGEKEYEAGGFSLNYSLGEEYHHDGNEQIALNIDGNSTQNKEFNTYIKLPSGEFATIKTQKDLNELEETAEKFLKKWLPARFKLPHVKKEKAKK